MKTIKLFIFLLFMVQSLCAQEHWNALRITDYDNQNQTNTWIDFLKTVEISSVPSKAVAKIACDSKYWLWINGELLVFEGQLKRGPTPRDTYYDEVDLAPNLKPGKNTIAVLVWYFGKEGFSHKSSGQAGLVFQCDELGIKSDKSWLTRLDNGFEQTNSPYPNFRLPESNIRFDARKGNFDWVKPEAKKNDFRNAIVVGDAESSPWNKLVKRPTPFWKDYGMKEYVTMPTLPFISKGDTIACRLPYNAQVTPYFKIESKSGLEIGLRTDHYFGGGPQNVRAEYVTREGIQEYESLGWMNGHQVCYYFPKGVKVLDLKYRETGFNTEFTGSFSCNDAFYNKLWKKAARTLYVTMRDTYMDCPDRERSQWWGDMVNESGESFYALSPSSASITKKGILELINWQREDGVIFSPIPAGNWNRELPEQMLASIGYYGFWNYYLNTGDKETIKDVYDGVKRYLNVWQLDKNGILVHREGDWYWGDWGTNIDKQGLYNAWYYLALKSYRNMSELLGNTGEVLKTEASMVILRKAFNEQLWNGKEYRSAGYKDDTDDRLQSLAVVAGLADAEKYPIIYNILQTKKYASPYMEKYVVEALFQMGYGVYGLERLKERFSKMVNDTVSTTLYENWDIGPDGFGGGSSNHAWSGGGLTILSQYVCGLSPLTPAWKTFKVKPMLGGLKYAETGNQTVSGEIHVKIVETDSSYKLDVKVPAGCSAIVCIPDKYKIIDIAGKNIFNIKPKKNLQASFNGIEQGYNCFTVKSGLFHFVAR